MAARKINVKLKTEDIVNDYFEHSLCIACQTTLPFYSFCQRVNNALFIDCRLLLDHSLEDKDEVRYKLFYDEDPKLNLEYFIIGNRERTNFLIPELKNMDYILMIRGLKLVPHLLESCLSKLQSIKSLTYAHEFEPLQIKSIENLVL